MEAAQERSGAGEDLLVGARRHRRTLADQHVDGRPPSGRLRVVAQHRNGLADESLDVARMRDMPVRPAQGALQG
jgi:hypothetical protein